MNDGPTLTALQHRLTEVRDSLGDVRMTIPASEIFARDRRRRAQHWQATAGVTAAAAAVAVSVALATSHPAARHPAARPTAASHPGSSQRASGPVVQLAAWTVTRQADGNIQITFREATDAAGLQRTLRADGVPASVTFTGQQNPACQPYPTGGWGLLTRVLGGGFKNPAAQYATQAALVIDPSKLPPGGGLQIAVMRGIPPGPSGPWPYPKGSGHPVVEVSLVKATLACTGS
jgi:hypothetical protein